MGNEIRKGKFPSDEGLLCHDEGPEKSLKGFKQVSGITGFVFQDDNYGYFFEDGKQEAH